MVKNPPANAGDVGLIPGSGRSLEKKRQRQSTPVFLLGESHGQRATVHGVAKSQTQLNTHEHALTAWNPHLAASIPPSPADGVERLLSPATGEETEAHAGDSSACI